MDPRINKTKVRTLKINLLLTPWLPPPPPISKIPKNKSFYHFSKVYSRATKDILWTSKRKYKVVKAKMDEVFKHVVIQLILEYAYLEVFPHSFNDI